MRAILVGCVSASALALAMTSVPAFAEEAAQTEKPAAKEAGLEEIIVTAQRREQSLSKVPVSVAAISPAELKTRAIEDVASIAKISPSVNFTTAFSSNASGFIIRGVSSASSEGGLQQSTAMVVDGVALARPGEFLGDLGDIQRVEILRGPQGTLFGKNATAGVVNIVTQRPTHKLAGYVEGTYTNDDEYLIRTMINVPLNDKIAFRANGYYNNLAPMC